MPRSLADGHTKWTLLTTAPADPANPTLAELQAGIDASGKTMKSDFAWGNAASDTVGEAALDDVGNTQAPGASNYDLAATFFRYFTETGASDSTGDDAAFQAVKAKGTEIWAYARETSKRSREAWAAGDEWYLGGKVMSDAPTTVDRTGYVKRRVVFFAQDMYEGGVVPTGV